MATQITQSSTSVNERGTVSFTVTTDEVANGTLYFSTAQIKGLIATTDFTDGTLTGSVGINTSGVGSISRTIVGDRSTEEIEIFQIEIRSGSSTGTLLVTSDLNCISNISVLFKNKWTTGIILVDLPWISLANFSVSCNDIFFTPFSYWTTCYR